MGSRRATLAWLTVPGVVLLFAVGATIDGRAAAHPPTPAGEAATSRTGGPAALGARQAGGDEGQDFFDGNCGMCHSPDGEWAFEKRPHRDADTYYEMLGRLPEINETMPPFPGDEAQRRAVAAYLAKVTAKNPPAKDKK